MNNKNLVEVSLIEAAEVNIPKILDMMESFNAIDNYPFDKNQRIKNISEFIENKELGRLWLITESNKVLGYLVLAYGYSFEYGGRDAIIDEFFILEEKRNQGIGQTVLRLLPNEIENTGIKAIHLEVENSNKRAQYLYQQNGFEGNKRGLLTKIIRK